jgi:hypothetical protein
VYAFAVNERIRLVASHEGIVVFVAKAVGLIETVNVDQASARGFNFDNRSVYFQIES